LVVDIELFGQLSPGVQRRLTLELEHPMTVQEVAILLGVDPGEIGLIVINGIQSELNDPVPPGCRLCFFPPMSGG
jgi:molybdopterin converting factor small subunit